MAAGDLAPAGDASRLARGLVDPLNPLFVDENAENHERKNCDKDNKYRLVVRGQLMN